MKKTLKNLFVIALVAAAVAVAIPAKAQQVYYGGIISTGLVTSTGLSTNLYGDTSKPPTLFVNPYVARDTSWFEVQKDRGVAIQIEYAGTSTNNLIVFEGSVNPNSRTNWTTGRFLTVNLPTGGSGVLLTNVPASALGNVRGIRLASFVNTNAAGTINITNVIVGTWK